MNLLLSLSLCQGFLNLTMWLYPDPQHAETDFKHTDSVKTAGETQSHSPTLCGGSRVELSGVGQVEISDEVTLEDLKTQVQHVD